MGVKNWDKWVASPQGFCHFISPKAHGKRKGRERHFGWNLTFEGHGAIHNLQQLN